MGVPFTSDDPNLADALFLVDHPGWTWRALQETPADVIALIHRSEQFLTEERRSRAKGARR